MFKKVYKQLRDVTNTVEQEVEFVILDNGSDEPMDELSFPGAKIVRYEESIGVYPTFNMGFIYATGDVVAFFHSDLVIWEKDWNLRVMGQFKKTSPFYKLGLMGFVGSNEIDSNGGRGGGTTSNFQGKAMTNIVIGDHVEQGKTYIGSPASAHGKTNSGFTPAAVVDGCAMIISRDAWNAIGFRENFPPHHFYDRLICTQVLEAGFKIEVGGIACDHFSGQTVNREPKYQTMAYEWLKTHVTTPNDSYKDFDPKHNYDVDIYVVAEKAWLEEYRSKGFVPCTVNL